MKRRRCLGIDAFRRLDFELEPRALLSGKESGVDLRLMSDYDSWR